MSDRRRPVYTLRQVFAAPLVLGVLSVIGLTTALVGDGIWDIVSWLFLGIPTVLCLWYSGWFRNRKASPGCP